MTFEFTFGVPTRVAFGPASLSQLPPAVAGAAARALLLAGGGSARRSGLLDRCDSALHEAGVSTVKFEGISSNPTYESVVAACRLAEANAVDAIVAVGGGSVMDAGRAVALALARPGDFWECRVTGSASVPGIPAGLTPVFTVPTVHGTGAEISPATLVRRGNLKEVFFSPHLFPRAAFVDPALACSAPPKITAEVGVDAFVQGLEAFVSPNAQPFSDMFAWEAMRLAVRWLPEAVDQPGNGQARSQVALSALLSLFAINQAGVGGIHALSNPLSGRYNVHHGRALSLVAAAVIEHNWAAAPERFAGVSRLFRDSAASQPSMAPDTEGIRGWLGRIGLGGRLSEYGVSTGDLDQMAAEAQNPDMSTNPTELSPPAVKKIYESVM